MFPASVRVQDKNLAKGNLSISKSLASAYFNEQISEINVLNEDNTVVIETYKGKELIDLMSTLFPFQDYSTGKIQYYLAKRK
jgi:hypothetical protein